MARFFPRLTICNEMMILKHGEFFLQGRVRIKLWMREHDTDSLKTHFGSLQLRIDILKFYSHLEEQIENVPSMIKATFGLGEEQ